MQRYNPKEIEPKWQAQWAADKIYETSDDSDKPKKYVLEYFPYPSGAAMHVGHVRNYTIGDVMARHARMTGHNVLHPMGWDAFGLPAENYAIKNNISPQAAIAENTAKFKQQLTQMGFSYDWSREINSSDPNYYRWTQWFFTLLFERGLAYQKDSLQWWCDTDKTVLANEQVEAGRCWRCGNLVVKKPLKQWFFRITDYADRLSADLDTLDWSEAIKTMQRNWIGRSEGAEIIFEVAEQTAQITVFTTRPDTLFGATFMVLAPEHPLLTTIVSDEQRATVDRYSSESAQKSDVERQENKQKSGVFTGAYAVNPINGERLPIWIADYVLMGYGTGAIMAVPAHDERDFEFAQMFALPIEPVIAPTDFGRGDTAVSLKIVDRPAVQAIAYDAKTGKYCLIEWHKDYHRAGLEWPGGGVDAGESLEQAVLREFTEETGYTDTTFKELLPCASARYFAEDNEITKRNLFRAALITLNSETHNGVVGTEAYEKNNYDVLWLTKDEILARLSEMAPAYRVMTEYLFNGTLPSSKEGTLFNSGPYDTLSAADAREKIVADLETTGHGKAVTNYKIRDWLISRQRYWGAPIPIIHCPTDGAVSVPNDQLPVVLPEVESYAPTGEGTSVLASVSDWVNVDCPKCGGPAKRETDTMDGFACSSWYFLRFADSHNDHAAFDPATVKRWLPVDDYIGGAEHAVMHLLYARMWTKVMYDAGLIEFSEPFSALRNQGMILAPDGRKMSKSWGNTITPNDIIDQGYGADAIRIMELFIGPWNQKANWSVEGMGGCYRFLQRIWTLCGEYLDAKPVNDPSGGPELQRVTHAAIKKVSEDVAQMGFNTAIAALMETVNELYKIKATHGYGDQGAWQQSLDSLVMLLAPFAPHVSEELWQQLGHTTSVHLADWPTYDAGYLQATSYRIAIQVNGKLRGETEVSADLDETGVVTTAQAVPAVAIQLARKTIRKTIIVPNKLVNFVAN